MEAPLFTCALCGKPMRQNAHHCVVCEDKYTYYAVYSLPNSRSKRARFVTNIYARSPERAVKAARAQHSARFVTKLSYATRLGLDGYARSLRGAGLKVTMPEVTS